VGLPDVGISLASLAVVYMKGVARGLMAADEEERSSNFAGR